MKKIISLTTFLALIVLILGCSKDAMEQSSTFTFKMEMSKATSSSPIFFDVTLYEYSASNERIANHEVRKAYFGSSKKFTANSQAQKVKVYFKMYAESSAVAPQYRWINQVYYLEKGKNVYISLADDTRIVTHEP